MRVKRGKNLDLCIPRTHKNCRICGIVITRTNFSRHVKRVHGGQALTLHLLKEHWKEEVVDLTNAGADVPAVSQHCERQSEETKAGRDVPNLAQLMEERQSASTDAGGDVLPPTKLKREVGHDVKVEESQQVSADNEEFKDWTMEVPASDAELEAVFQDLLGMRSDEETLKGLLQQGSKAMLDSVCQDLGLEIRACYSDTSTIDTSVLTRAEKLKLYKKLGAELIQDF